jgi:hypothetical protein
MDSGHYVIWTRNHGNSSNWIKISDTTLRNYKKYSNSQNNVQLYFAQNAMEYFIKQSNWKRGVYV